VAFRKLADLGYKRSAKKCKEKFDNVHKYYKRTKEGRTGRHAGKSYRFFDELEALHAAAPQPQPPLQKQHQQLPPASTTAPPLHAFAAPVSAPPPISSMPPPTGPMQPAPILSAAPAVQVQALVELPGAHQPLNLLQGFSFSSMSESESEDDDMMAETGGSQDRLGKRKRGGDGGSGSKKTMSFFEGLMQQVVDRQEEMQRRFLETMETREAERTAREEAWRRQEVARLNREQEQLAQERAAAASRDAAIIAFLQRIGGQSVQPPTAVVVPTPAPVPAAHTTPPPKQPSRQQQPPSPQATPQPKPISAAPLQQHPTQQQPKDASQQDAGTPRSAPATSGPSLELVPVADHHVESGLGRAASSSRWPKTEVDALIQLRMDLDMRYLETGAKGPLWEDISSGMRRLGYNRSSKRCKEKWENINKYYKKVKESNKKRPEDSKTCPYFHQLEAIYIGRKHLRSGGAAAAAPPAPAYLDQLNSSRHEIEGKNINDDKRNNGGSGGGTQVPPTSNGETAPTTTLAAFGTDTGMKKVTTPCVPSLQKVFLNPPPPPPPFCRFVLDRRRRLADRICACCEARRHHQDVKRAPASGVHHGGRNGQRRVHRRRGGRRGRRQNAVQDTVPEAEPRRHHNQHRTSTASDDACTSGADFGSEQRLPCHGSIGARAPPFSNRTYTRSNQKIIIIKMRASHALSPSPPPYQSTKHHQSITNTTLFLFIL
jgi:hypothetical protein